MNEQALKELLENIKSGNIDTESAFAQLKELPYKDLGFAKVDNHRQIRTGLAEVIFCEGKKTEQITDIITYMKDKGSGNIIGTRLKKEVFNEIAKVHRDAVYYEDARIISISKNRRPLYKGIISVVCGGTSDIPVAEEAAVVAELMGNRVERIYDVGVAGIHRLLMQTDKLQKSTAIVAVAGMEGALPSVVCGLVSCPVIAVPTSIGYGANFGGLSALLCMLNSCAAGISVVNIDNGFGGGYSAAVINRLSGEI